MNYNRKIIISTATNRKTHVWQKEELYWSEFAEGKLKLPHRSTETLEEYLKLPKSKQDELKDVGGFVGGALKDDRRKANNVLFRDLITLDLDNIETGKTEEVLKRIEGLDCAYAVYSTRKHASYKPRLRVVFPTDRSVTTDEYEPIARKLGSLIGIYLCDSTTFEASRLMYYPSCCKDSEYVYRIADKPFLNADGILGLYDNWKDITQWPQVPGSDIKQKRLLTKQEDPLTKKGIVGAFCRTYNIYDAINTFIPGAYEPCDVDNRFTYLGGSTTGGAIVYDDKFMYSHHATDPISGKLCNAFDLIRYHKYGDLDDEAKEGTPNVKLPSYLEMKNYALSIEAVAKELKRESYEKAQATYKGTNVINFPNNNQDSQVFTPISDAGQVAPAIEVNDLNWMNCLAVNSNGNYLKTINNIVLILENNPEIKGKIVLDEFANRGLVLGSLPWNPSIEKRLWSDVDDAGLTRYLETFFQITGKDKIANALLIVSYENKINEVKQYLTGLKWDNVKRIETLLHDYMGAEQNAYTAQVMRKFLTAAVARVMQDKVKFDCMPILTGPQGIGKSTFIGILGKDWFSDSLQSFEGKEAAEMIQGTWINEIGELTGMYKSEINTLKQFLSKKEDIYRAAYGRRTEKYPRRCVFFGTSNDEEFLKDITGNRRFWPVDVGINQPIKSVFTDLEDEVDQVWAEAFTYWQLGEFLDLTGEAKNIAEHEQEKHSISNPKEGMIREFLNRKITTDWDSKSLSNRKLFYSGQFNTDGVELVERKKVCALEIWVECFGGDIRYLKRQDSIEINNILTKIEGWKKTKSVRHYGYCGRQKGFEKI